MHCGGPEHANGLGDGRPDSHKDDSLKTKEHGIQFYEEQEQDRWHTETHSVAAALLEEFETDGLWELLRAGLDTTDLANWHTDMLVQILDECRTSWCLDRNGLI